MSLVALITADNEAVFMNGGLAQSVTYEQGALNKTMQAVQGTLQMEVEMESITMAQVVFYISTDQFDEAGIAEPKLQDKIDGRYIVIDRSYSIGMWRLICIDQMRPRT